MAYNLGNFCFNSAPLMGGYDLQKAADLDPTLGPGEIFPGLIESLPFHVRVAVELVRPYLQPCLDAFVNRVQ